MTENEQIREWAIQEAINVIEVAIEMGLDLETVKIILNERRKPHETGRVQKYTDERLP